MQYEKIIQELKIHQIELEMQNEELRKAQYDLQKEKNNYSSLIELLPIGFIIFDEDYQIRLANNHFCKLMNSDEKKLLKNDFSGLIHHHYQDDFFRASRQAVNNSSNTAVCIIKLVDEDGKIITVQFKIRYSTQEKVFNSIVEDISEKIIFDLQLKKLRKAVDQSANHIVITDIDANIEYANKKFFKLTGFKKEEIIGKKPSIFKSNMHNSEFYKEMWDTILSGNVWKGEMINRKKNGELYCESAMITPVYNDDNKIINFIAIKEDITEAKQNKIELKKAKEIAEKANSLKSVILGNISHELRTPLNGILGGIQIIKSYENYYYKDVISIIEESAERLNDSLGLMLELSNMRTQDKEIFLQKIDLTEHLNNLKFYYEELCSNDNIKFRLDIKCNKSIVKIDISLFNKILKQLIKNSIKFSKDGNIILGLFIDDNSKVNIFVEDDGVGIPEEKLKVIFEDFRQVSEGVNRKYEGLGLGLTFVAKTVDLFEGDVKIKSKINEGTKIIIILNNFG